MDTKGDTKEDRHEGRRKQGGFKQEVLRQQALVTESLQKEDEMD